MIFICGRAGLDGFWMFEVGMDEVAMGDAASSSATKTSESINADDYDVI